MFNLGHYMRSKTIRGQIGNKEKGLSENPERPMSTDINLVPKAGFETDEMPLTSMAYDDNQLSKMII